MAGSLGMDMSEREKGQSTLQLLGTGMGFPSSSPPPLHWVSYVGIERTNSAPKEREALNIGNEISFHL